MPVLAYNHFTTYLQQFLRPESSETLKGSYTSFSALWDKDLLTKNSDNP